MKKRTDKLWIAALAIFAISSCQREELLETSNNHSITIAATIGDPQEETLTRAATSSPGETYSTFASGDCFGVYSEGGLQVANTGVTLDGNRKWTAAPVLEWDKTAAVSKPAANLNAYFPYSDKLEGYTIVESGKLKDVLVAERTNIVYGNPAIYLTFTHRFALLRIELGNGFDGFSGTLQAHTSQGIDEQADIDKGKIAFKAGAATNFSSTVQGGKYYIIVPAGSVAGSDSITLTKLGIGTGDEVEIKSLPTLTPNTLYNLTVYKLDNGTPALRMGKIEQWAQAKDLGSVKGRPGIYTPEDLVAFGKAYNVYLSTAAGATNEEKGKAAGLSEFGYWQVNDANTVEATGKWVIYLRKNLHMTDIDIAEYTFTNHVTSQFIDLFKGEGRTINGLIINGENGASSATGIFGILKGKIENLTLTDVSVKGNSCTGILAGKSEAGSEIKNCHLTGTSAVSGTSSVGGLIGEGTVYAVRCSAFATVSSAATWNTYSRAGGLIGKLTGGEVNRCFAKSSVTGTSQYVGGLIGEAFSATIIDSYATGNVYGDTEYVGGLIGCATATISYCYATGTVGGKKSGVGGLLGFLTGYISHCSATGNVSGSNRVGGLIGQIADANTISYCFAQGKITASDSDAVKGGLLGEGTAAIYYCYAINGTPLCGNSQTPTYSYDTANQEGAANETNHFYSISLTDIPVSLLSLLNSEQKATWTSAFLLIDGKGYTLPVLTEGSTPEAIRKRINTYE